MMNLIDQYNLRFKNVWQYDPYFYLDGRVSHSWTTMYKGRKYLTLDRNPPCIFCEEDRELLIDIYTLFWVLGRFRKIKVGNELNRSV